MGGDFLHADGQTDKANSRFSQFWEGTKKKTHNKLKNKPEVYLAILVRKICWLRHQLFNHPLWTIQFFRCLDRGVCTLYVFHSCICTILCQTISPLEFLYIWRFGVMYCMGDRYVEWEPRCGRRSWCFLVSVTRNVGSATRELGNW